MKKFLFSDNSHKFETKKHKKQRKTRGIVILISVAVLLLGSVSLFFLFSNYDFNISNIFGEQESSSSSEESTTDVLPAVEGNANILLTLHNENELKFICILKANVASKTISVCSFDANSVVDSQTLAEKYSTLSDNSRMDEFKTAVSKLSGVNIDKYVSSDYSQFTRTVSTMGGVTMNIPEDISYNSDDIMLSLKKGEWKLIGPNLLNYLLISKNSTQNDIIVAMIKEYLTQKNVENGENIFRTLVNILDTDITAFDFNSALPSLKYLVSGDAQINLTTFTLKG